MNVKISDSGACTQEMICGGVVQILLVKLGPLRCFMSTRMEHNGECSHRRSTEVVIDTIDDTCLILDVEMELLQVGGTLLLVVVLRFPLCSYELQRLVINVYDHLFPQNVMFPLKKGLYNGIHILVIGGVFPDNIGECLTMVCHWMPMLSKNCAHNIVRCISLNLEWLLQIRQGEYWS
jgi:hypothetical protein